MTCIHAPPKPLISSLLIMYFSKYMIKRGLPATSLFLPLEKAGLTLLRLSDCVYRRTEQDNHWLQDVRCSMKWEQEGKGRVEV